MNETNNKIVVDFEPLSRRIFFLNDKTIYENLIKAGIQIRSLCGGKGSCGKCKILIERGIEFMNSPTTSEKKYLSNKKIKENWRLACQTYIKENLIDKLRKISAPQLRIYLPEEILYEDFKILTSGIGKGVKINPAIKKLYLEVHEPFLEEPIADFERILKILKIGTIDGNLSQNLIINLGVLKKIPKILRDNDHKITLTIWDDKEIIDCEPGNTIDKNFGIAFDIGTTTIVGYLINLNDGKIHAISSKLNPQTAFGEDVISRLNYIKDKKDGLQELNTAVLNALNDIIIKTCSMAGIHKSQIYEASIVGNTVMHHIFLALNPVNIGLSPYIPVIQKDLNIKSKDLNLKISDQGYVYVAPIIAGFVGADTIGVMLSSQIEDESELSLVLDIGTNGEIVIGNKDILATGSCAAGSALEGAHITHGMRAAAGAIDTVKIDPSTYEVHYTTIKNKNPRGLCGSGLIDLVAEMLRSKILTRSGNFNVQLKEPDLILNNNGKKEFIIVQKDDSDINQAITISQDDIRQVQMAKGAFYSGMRIILNHLNELNKTETYKIEQIFLAGAFGNYIDKNNAKFIGMIPDLPSDKIYQIGNAAGIGSQYLLLNKDLRKKTLYLLKKTQYIEIGAKIEFQKEFAEAMYFPHLNLDYFPSLSEYLDISKR